MDDLAPFDPPSAPIAPAKADPVARGRKGRIVWLVFYFLNVIVPAILATGVVSPTGWLGVAGGVALLAWAGFWTLKARPGLTSAAVPGAIFVALSQLMPLFQMYAGLLALAVVQGVGELAGVGSRRGPNSLEPPGAGLATILTGLELIAVSLVVGIALRAIGRAFRGPSPVEQEPPRA